MTLKSDPGCAHLPWHYLSQTSALFSRRTDEEGEAGDIGPSREKMGLKHGGRQITLLQLSNQKFSILLYFILPHRFSYFLVTQLQSRNTAK